MIMEHLLYVILPWWKQNNMSKIQRIIELEEWLLDTTEVVRQNSNMSQKFADEQQQINAIVSKFKEKTEEEWKIWKWRINSLQSQIDKLKNVISHLVQLSQLNAEMFDLDWNDINDLKSFNSLLIELFNLKIVETPSVEGTISLVSEKIKKTKKWKK